MVYLKTLSFSQAGNRKDLRIGDPETGEIFWKKALLKEVFCRDWLAFPTIMFSIDMNIFMCYFVLKTLVLIVNLGFLS